MMVRIFGADGVAWLMLATITAVVLGNRSAGAFMVDLMSAVVLHGRNGFARAVVSLMPRLMGGVMFDRGGGVAGLLVL